LIVHDQNVLGFQDVDLPFEPIHGCTTPVERDAFAEPGWSTLKWKWNRSMRAFSLLADPADWARVASREMRELMFSPRLRSDPFLDAGPFLFSFALTPFILLLFHVLFSDGSFFILSFAHHRGHDLVCLLVPPFERLHSFGAEKGFFSRLVLHSHASRRHYVAIRRRKTYTIHGHVFTSHLGVPECSRGPGVHQEVDVFVVGALALQDWRV
jgi:hypothetical protein